MAEQRDVMDPQAQLVRDGMTEYHRLRSERDKLHAMCNNWERSHSMLQSECEMLKRRVTALESEKGFYQRFSSELVAHVGDIGRLAETVLVKSRQGAYRPNGAAPRQHDEQADQDEVPRFLTAHADRPSDGLEEDIQAQVRHHQERVRGFDDEHPVQSDRTDRT